MAPPPTPKRVSKSRRPVGSITAVLLLLLISVASSLTIYWLLTSLSGNAKQASMSSGGGVIEVEQVSPVRDEELPGKCYALDVVIRNVGGEETRFYNKGIYIHQPGEKNPRAWLWQVETQVGKVTVLRPGEVVGIRLFSTGALPPGRYVVSVLAGGMRASSSFLLPCSLGKSSVFEVHTSNDTSSPVTGEDTFATYMLWSSAWGSYYKIEFRIYAKEDVTINGVRAELFNSTFRHPAWVGGNPWHYTSPFTYPDYTGAYWTPVSAGEMPVYVVITVYK